MASWDYGAEGRAYRVLPGTSWMCGRHLFTCVSAFEVTTLGAITLVYSDPPWNQGNVNSFRTKAGLGRAEHTWLDLYSHARALAGVAPCFLEGGVRQAPEVQAMLAGRVPFRHVIRQWPITYYRRQRAVLHYTGPDPGALDPSGLDDDDTPVYVLARFPAGTVGDPCAGRGLTSRAAEAAGWASVNTELHPARVSAALARLRAMTGCPVWQLGP
jgi:hypothetical protein